MRGHLDLCGCVRMCEGVWVCAAYRCCAGVEGWGLPRRTPIQVESCSGHPPK